MKNILVLSRRDDRPTFDRTESMLAGMQDINTENNYTGADYEDLLFVYDGKDLKITDSKSKKDIAEFDAIFFIGWFKTKPLDDTARAVAHYAKHKNIPFVNSEAYHGRSFSKLSQCVIGVLNGAVNVTPFIFSMDSTVLENAITDAPFLGKTFILKATAASRGNDNYLIKSAEQLHEVLSQESDPPKYFIAQTFIPNDGDYRVIVMGEKVRLIIHRKSQSDSHLNNTSQGGSAELVEVNALPDHVLQQSIDMARLLKREVSGVDMIQHNETGEYYFLEANNMPQLSTGSFVPVKMKILDQYLTELANGETPRYL